MSQKSILEIIKKEVRFEFPESKSRRNSLVTGLWNFSSSCLVTSEQKKKIASNLKNKLSMGRVLIISSQKYKLQSQNKKEVIRVMEKMVNHALKEK